MKRSSTGGNSPPLKHLNLTESSDSDVPRYVPRYIPQSSSSSSEENAPSFHLNINTIASSSSISQVTDNDSTPSLNVATSSPIRHSSSSIKSTEIVHNLDFLNQYSSSPISQDFTIGPIPPQISNSSADSQLSTPETVYELNLNIFPEDNEAQLKTEATSILDDLIREKGASSVAEIIMQNDALHEELLHKILARAAKEFKASVKSSVLKTKKERNYLLTLSPRLLCEEFKVKSPLAFTILTKGLFGVSDENTVFSSQHLMNDVSLILSTIAKRVNRLATGFALLLTTELRSGGLREDSIKLLSALVHPRTSQKYDRQVLSKEWDAGLKACLQDEKEFFISKRQAELKLR